MLLILLLLMSQIVSDDFTRLDAATLGGNWTNSVNSGFGIVSNKASEKSAGISVAVYTGAAWAGGGGGANQYCEATVNTKLSGDEAGVVARGATGAETFYVFELNDNDAAVALGSSMRCGLYKAVSGAYTL